MRIYADLVRWLCKKTCLELHFKVDSFSNAGKLSLLFPFKTVVNVLNYLFVPIKMSDF